MLTYLWDNGLVRALLGAFVLVWTFAQEPIMKVAVSDQQWIIAAGVSAFFFGSAAVRAGKGSEPEA